MSTTVIIQSRIKCTLRDMITPKYLKKTQSMNNRYGEYLLFHENKKNEKTKVLIAESKFLTVGEFKTRMIYLSFCKKQNKVLLQTVRLLLIKKRLKVLLC